MELFDIFGRYTGLVKETVETDQAIEQLEAITERLNSDDLSDEETLRLCEEGKKLAAQIEAQLGEQKRQLKTVGRNTAEITAIEENQDGVI